MDNTFSPLTLPISNSPTSVGSSFSPLLESIPESYISWKDTKDPSAISSSREFERTNAEYWMLFSRECPYFPHIGSSEEARKFLSELKSNLYTSQFMPLFPRISLRKSLSLIYEKIRNNPMTPRAIEISGYYLFKKCLTDPESCSLAVSLLRGKDWNLHTPSEDRSLFESEYNKAIQLGSLPTFVQTLFEIIPIEEVAKIRLDADMIAMVDQLNHSLDPVDRFLHMPIHGYAGYTSYISDLKDWLVANRDKLSTIKSLDLSQSGIQRIPQELLPYLAGLEEVQLCNTIIDDPTILIDLLKLPALKMLHFSSNQFTNFDNFTATASLPLLRAVASAKHLELLDLSGNSLTFYDLTDLIKHCSDRSIDLILDCHSENEMDSRTLCERINDEIHPYSQISIPSSSLFDPQLFGSLLQESLQENREYIQNIYNLDLSESRITFFPPELVSLLSSVRMVNFSKNYYEGCDLFSAIQTLLQLDSLEFIDLSSNNMNAEFLHSLIPDIENSQTLKKIRISNNLFAANEITDFISACTKKNINVCSLSSKQKDLISFYNELNLISPISKYTSDQYDFLSQKLPEVFNGAMKEFDLSNLSIQALPEEVVPYLSSLEYVTFAGRRDVSSNVVPMIRDILRLPNLKIVNFAENNLTDDDLISLIEDFKQARSLKGIVISNNPLNPDLHSEFLQYCKENGILLLRPLRAKEQEFSIAWEKILENLPQIQKQKPASFVDEKDLATQIHRILEKNHRLVATIKHLDFSDLKLGSFPSSWIPYLEGVTSVCLNNTTPDSLPDTPYMARSHQLLANMLRLPNLEEMDLSNNFLSPSSFACLFMAIENPKSKIRKIDISHCSGREDLMKNFYKLCALHQVELVRPLSQQESVLMDTVKKLNEDLPSQHQILVPSVFVDYQDCLLQVQDSLERQKFFLQQIKSFQFSESSVRTLQPELFRYLTGIEKLSMRNCFPQGLRSLQPLYFLSQFPNLKSIDLSGTTLGMPQNLLDLILLLQRIPTINSIDLSRTDINLTNARDLISYCNKNKIKLSL